MKDTDSEPLINYTANPRTTKENDLENDFNYGNNVMSASAEIRKGFLRKVYGILTVQLIMTTGVSGKHGHWSLEKPPYFLFA